MIKAKSVIIDIAIIIIAVSTGLIIKTVYDITSVADKTRKSNNAAINGDNGRIKQPDESGTSVTDDTSELNQELFNAAKNGDIDQVQKLVEKGADVNSVNNLTGTTALMIASQKGYLDVTKFLVDKGADVNAAATGRLSGYTALMLASTQGHLDVVKFLVDKGADVNTHGSIGDTPLFMASAMGHLDIVKFLVDEGADVNVSADTGLISGFTPLMAASIDGFLGIVEFLVDKGADVNAVDNANNSTALMFASQLGHFDIVKFLVDKGADLNAVTTGDEGGFTALMLASQLGQFDTVKFLVDKGANVNVVTTSDEGSHTALTLASQGGYLDVVKILVANCADVNTVSTGDVKGTTALMLASQRGHFDTVKFLVECRADTEVADQEGKTARDYAIKRIKTKVSDYIEKLLKYNPFTCKSYKSTFTYFTQTEDVAEFNTKHPAVKGLLKKDSNGINDIGNYRQIIETPDTHLEITIDLAMEENKLVFKYGTDHQSKEINDRIPLYQQIFTEDAADTHAYIIFPKEWKVSEQYQEIEAIKNSDSSHHSIMASPPENSEFSELLRNYNALLEGSFWSIKSDKPQLERAVDIISDEDENERIEQLQEKYKDYQIYKIPFFIPEGVTQAYSNIARSSTIYFDKSSLTGNGKIFIEIPQITFKLAASEAAKKANIEGLAYELDLPEIGVDYDPEYRFIEESSGLEKKRIDLGGDITMEFVYIPAGEFMMGSPPWNEDHRGHNDERPRHQVKISKSFWMGIYEVTNGQYQQFVKESNYDGKRESNANFLRHILVDNTKMPEDGPGYPVFWVSWDNAQAFCEWLSVKEGKTYRLPTEAEWEYACRAGTTTEIDIEDDGLFLKSGGMRRIHPAGQFQPNPFGLYDMYNNVREWCRDWYGSYSDANEVDPEGPESGDRRVVRSDYSGDIISYRCAERFCYPPNNLDNEIGFRVVCEDSE